MDKTMRTIMMSLVLAAMSGCATTSGGVNTTFYRVNADDCEHPRAIAARKRAAKEAK